jgi:hypothetical protein
MLSPALAIGSCRLFQCTLLRHRRFHEAEGTVASSTALRMGCTKTPMAATTISRNRRRSIRAFNASISRLIFRSDCNDGPSPICRCRLVRNPMGAAAFPAERARSRRTISARWAAVNWKFGDIEREYPPVCQPLTSTAGDAHVAADARAVVPAVDDEVMALGLEPDGAVDGLAEQAIVHGSP